MREAATITTIIIIKITPPAIIDEERSNEETMRSGDDKVTGATKALIRNGMLRKRIVMSRPRNTNGSRIEAYQAPT